MRARDGRPFTTADLSGDFIEAIGFMGFQLNIGPVRGSARDL